MMRLTRLWLALALLLSAAPALAEGLSVSDPWVREVPPTSQVSAAYMVIRNEGAEARTLVGATSPSFAKVEIHQVVNQGGMAMMVAIPSLAIPAHGEVALAPGGYHLMLIAAAHPLRAGGHVPLDLHFKNGEKVAVHAPIKRMAGGHGMEHHHHGAAAPAADQDAQAHHPGMSHEQHAMEHPEMAHPHHQHAAGAKCTCATAEGPGKCTCGGDAKTCTCPPGQCSCPGHHHDAAEQAEGHAEGHDEGHGAEHHHSH